MPLTTRSVTYVDQAAIFSLHCAAFGGDAEARLVEALHMSGDVRLSLVAEQAGQIVGHILFSELSITTPEGQTSAGLALAPLAVHPDWQRQGIGTALTFEALQQLHFQDWRWVIVLGDPAYYGRFGFTAERARHLNSPYAGEYFLALDLQEADDSDLEFGGDVAYPAPFGDLA